MRVFKEFRFEAGHRLIGVAPDHKCARQHGHSYLVRVTCEGSVHPRSGMVIDYADIATLFEERVGRILDHQNLNGIRGLENSTSEVLAKWIWDQLDPGLPLVEVLVRETATAGAVYNGE